MKIGYIDKIKTYNTKKEKNTGLKGWNYVQDYSRHDDVNIYLTSILGERFNKYRHRWREASGLKKVFDFPLFLVFETMFKCNLKCIMCIHSNPDKQKYSYDKKLPFDMFKKIMRESSSHYCPSLTIGGTSEPLLDKDLINMIQLAKKTGFIDIMLNTNATLLNRAMSRRLIESGLTRLRIGFDGLTASTYEKIRIGASFEKVKNNIMNFIKIRNEMNSKLPIVRVSCVHLSKNEREIEGFVELWRSIVDYVSIQMYRPHEFTKERLRLVPFKKNITADVVCSEPFNRLYIRGNGDVHGCCNVVFGPKVGNVFNSSIYDIWHSDNMTYLRGAMKNGGWSKIPACRDCLNNARSR